MSPLACRADNLGKLYRIGARRAAYKTLRGSITDKRAARFRFFRNPHSARPGAGPLCVSSVSVPAMK